MGPIIISSELCPNLKRKIGAWGRGRVGDSQTNYNILFWGLPSGNCTLKNIKVTKDKSGLTTSIPKIDRDLTVEFVADKIVEHFPTLGSGKSDFLQKNRRYVELLSSSEIINNEMVRMMPTTCPKCVRPSLLSWRFKAKTASFLSMGQLKIINIPVRTCPTCSQAFYPQMYEHGLFTIHNKLTKFKEASTDDQIRVYSAPENNLIVPSFTTTSHPLYPFTEQHMPASIL